MIERATTVAATTVLLLTSVLLPAGAAHADTFLGTWESVDLDGSNQWLSISEDGGALHARLLDDNVSGGLCEWNGEPRGAGTAAGPAVVLEDGRTLRVTYETVRCLVDGSEHVGLGLDVEFVHNPRRDTLRDSFGIVWRRPRPGGPASSFDGRWISTDIDGSSQRLHLRGQGDTRRVKYVDDAAPGACADGGPAQLTGTGQIPEDGATVHVTLETLRCAGGQPNPDLAVPFGVDFVHDFDTNTLLDSWGVVWRRR